MVEMKTSQSEDHNGLEIIELQCPSCSFNNERGARHCGKCGNPLVKTCPVSRCGTEMRWDLAYCPNCGSNYAEALAQAEAERRKLAQQKAEEAGRRTTLWYIIIALALVIVVLCFLVFISLN